MRSVSANGPIGWAQPCTMPLSMSSADAKPDSSMRIAERRYGISRALTTKPARSCDLIRFLPSRSTAKSPAVVAVVSLVRSDETSSTSGRTGTGLKKCSPTTCSGRCVAMASFMMGMDDVFEASTVSSLVTTPSSALNTASFSSSTSGTASTMRSRSASASMSSTTSRWARTRSTSSVESLPRLAAFASDRSMRSRPALAAAAPSSTTTTSHPARADTSAMPEPINPQPTTPTRSIAMPAR